MRRAGTEARRLARREGPRDARSGRSSGRTTASDYLNEPINYGGEVWTRGDVIADMQRQGHRRNIIDRYMEGA